MIFSDMFVDSKNVDVGHLRILRLTIKSGMFPLAMWSVKRSSHFIFNLYRLSFVFLPLGFSEVFKLLCATFSKIH